MSAALPPVPDLIPISALRKGSTRSTSASSDYSAGGGGSNSDCADGGGGCCVAVPLGGNNNDSDCEEDLQVKLRAPCSSTQCSGEVMGEQRSRRTRQPATTITTATAAAASAAAAAGMVIDTPRSRGRDDAAPGASRKTERHRKSGRRRDRDRDRARRKRSSSSKRLHNNNNNYASAIAAATTTADYVHTASSSPSVHSESPAPSPLPLAASSPRVNPIFVWVRQEDTHIVEVKCEDYDKRNRILLTKTAQGWRAIPRTETLAPVLQKDDAAVASTYVRNHHKKRTNKHRSHSNKLKRKTKTFGVQVDESDLQPEIVDSNEEDPLFTDDELIVSHASGIPPLDTLQDQQEQQQHNVSEPDVNNRECSASVTTAAAADEASVSAPEEAQSNISPLDNLLAVAELEFNQQIEAERWRHSSNARSSEDDELELFIESCSTPVDTSVSAKASVKDDCECDYNEEDDNNLAMDDILSRLEQSLQSPDAMQTDIEMIRDRSDESKQNMDNLPIVDTIEEIIEIANDKYETRTIIDLAYLNPHHDCEADSLVTEDEDDEDDIKEIIDDAKEVIEVHSSDSSTVEEYSLTKTSIKAEIKNVDEREIVEVPSEQHMDCEESVASAASLKYEESDDFQESDIPEKLEESAISEESPNSEETEVSEKPTEEELKDTPEDARNPKILIENTEPKEEPDISIKTDDSKTSMKHEETTEPEDQEEVEDAPTDLRVQTHQTTKACDQYEDIMPTDLSIRKCARSPLIKRPPSQNSETIQSPQPSGIPAVPPSPDLNSANKNNKPNNYLESLLSPNKEQIMTEREPLNLGKNRESDSPKVTCSQEEPPSKKIKLEDLTLKKLLVTEQTKDNKTLQPIIQGDSDSQDNRSSIDTPRLLELLTQDEDEMDPVVQLNQVLTNTALNIPDPMLIPKDRLSQILQNPGKEIPKLLKQRPELRLPEALAYPHLLQDPDILVITLTQLKLIVEKQSQSLPVVEKEKEHHVNIKENDNEVEKPIERKPTLTIPEPRKILSPPKVKSPTEHVREQEPIKEKEQVKKSKISELSNDIDAATTAAFSQMMWLPYLNQLEAMKNPEFLKFLSTMLPGYHPPDMSHLMRPPPPPTFPLPQSPLNYNPLELSMWQEAMRAKNQLDLINNSAAKLLSKNNSLPNIPTIPNLTNPYQHQFSQPSLPSPLQPQFSPAPTTTPPATPRYQNRSKTPSNYPSNKQPSNTYHQQQNLQRNYDNEKLLQQQQQQQQHLVLQRQKQQQEFLQQRQQQMQQRQQKQQQQQRKELFKQQEEYLKQQQEEYMKQQQEEYLKQHQELYQKPKVACKPFANLVQPQMQFNAVNTPNPIQQHQQQLEQYRHYQQQLQEHHRQQQHKQRQQLLQQQQAQLEKRNRILPQGPIDLSGGPQHLSGKLKTRQRQHLVDPKSATRMMKYDEMPEVGSTTTIDDMHEAHKHLWHPLFGNQKSYANPWNWSTVTATGE